MRRIEVMLASVRRMLGPRLPSPPGEEAVRKNAKDYRDTLDAFQAVTFAMSDILAGNTGRALSRLVRVQVALTNVVLPKHRNTVAVPIGWYGRPAQAKEGR